MFNSVSGTGIGISNLPNQQHRRAFSRGLDLNILIVGECGLGKESLVNLLFAINSAQQLNCSSTFKGVEERTATLVEGEFKTRLCLAFASDFGNSIDNTGCWVPICDYIDEMHQLFMNSQLCPEVSQRDCRIHACLFFISPHSKRLRLLDLEAMRALGGRCNVIPLIAKSDCLSPKERSALKEAVLRTIKDEEITTIAETMQTMAIGEKLRSYFPLAVSSRQPEPEGCDLEMLRDLLLRVYTFDLFRLTDERFTRALRLRNDAVDKAPRISRLSLAATVRDELEAFAEREEMRLQELESQLREQRLNLEKEIAAEHAIVRELQLRCSQMKS